MEAKNKFIEKILPIFINAGFGVEKFDDTTFDIIDRSIIGKAKIGSVKVLENGDLSVKLGGEAKQHAKFVKLMKDTGFKSKPIKNTATVGKQVKDLIKQYKNAKKTIYKESYSALTDNIMVDVTRNKLEEAIDEYLSLCDEYLLEETRTDLLTYVADKLTLTEDECEAKYGDVLDLCLDYDEDTFNHTMDRIFEESEIKSDFRNFIMEAKQEDLLKEIKEDKVLRRLRDTDAYKNTDAEGKYRKIWRYVVQTHGSKFGKNEDLENLCRQIADEDEDIF